MLKDMNIKKPSLILLLLPLSLFACGPTIEDLRIFLAYVIVSITLFIWSFSRLKKAKSKWYFLGLVPLLSLVLLIVYTYVDQETNWLDEKSHYQQELHPWKVELDKR